MTTNRTAIYCQKSVEDDESIQLQERIVRDYVKGKKELTCAMGFRHMEISVRWWGL